MKWSKKDGFLKNQPLTRPIVGARKTIAEQFVDKRTLFWRYKSRRGINDVYLEPTLLVAPRRPFQMYLTHFYSQALATRNVFIFLIRSGI